MKNTAIAIFAGLFLLFVTGKSLQLYFEKSADYKRMESNYKISQDSTKYFKGRSGELAGKVTAQEMTIKEIRSLLPSVISDIKDLYIRPQNVKSFVQTSTETRKEIIVAVVPVKQADLSHPQAESTKSFHYTDKWFTAEGLIKADTARLTIVSSDTIKTIIHQSRIHPALWIFSRKTYKAVVTNVNPFVKLSIDKCIIVRD